MTQLLQFARVEADKRANNKVGTVLLDTLYIIFMVMRIKIVLDQLADHDHFQ